MTWPLVTVISVGTPYRHDDGVGAAVLERLSGVIGTDDRVRLVELDGEPVRLIHAWEGSPTVWIVDAVRSGRPPGTIHLGDALDGAGQRDDGGSLEGGHAMGLADALALAGALDLVPSELRVLGIEGERFDEGIGLTTQVAAAVVEAADLLVAAIEAAVSGSNGSTGTRRSS